MFGTVLDKIQALFARSFLLGNFFPMLIFTAVNVAIAATGIEGVSRFLATSVFQDGGPSAVTVVATLLAVAVLAYMLAPMVPLFRSALDGKFLCPWLFEALREAHIERVKHLRDQRDAVALRLKDNKRKIDAARSHLIDARSYGNAHAGAINRRAFDEAEKSLNNLRNDVLKKSTYGAAGRFPDDRLVKSALATVASALHSNPSDLPLEEKNYSLARSVDQLQLTLISELQRLDEVASRWAQTAHFELVSRYDIADIKPTRVGNSRAAIERYPAVAYNADFYFLWPRLRMVLGDNKDLSAALDDATAQLDFAVLMTMLSAVTVVVWIPILIAFGTSIWPFIAVGLVGPPSVVFFYLLVDETQNAFGATVTMVIDATRLKLLTALHQPLPSSSAAEKETWRRMQDALYTEGGPSMRYRHPTAT